MYDFFAIYVHFLFIFGFLCGWKEKKLYICKQNLIYL